MPSNGDSALAFELHVVHYSADTVFTADFVDRVDLVAVKRIRSERVVFPESMWALIPIFLIWKYHEPYNSTSLVIGFCDIRKQFQTLAIHCSISKTSVCCNTRTRRESPKKGGEGNFRFHAGFFRCVLSFNGQFSAGMCGKECRGQESAEPVDYGAVSVLLGCFRAR